MLTDSKSHKSHKKNETLDLDAIYISFSLQNSLVNILQVLQVHSTPATVVASQVDGTAAAGRMGQSISLLSVPAQETRSRTYTNPKGKSPKREPGPSTGGLMANEGDP